jgi:regulatory protein
MVSAVLGDASSSLSANSSVRIVSVEKRASDTVKITVGGSCFLFRESYLPLIGFDGEGLVVGAELDEAAMEALALALAATEAEKRALGLLARAEQSRFLLSGKLELRGCGPKAIALALDFLEGEGLLDDRRFAEAWLRSRSGSSSLSPRKMLAGLRSRGIKEGIASAALARVFDEEGRKALLEKALKKEMSRPGGGKDSLRAALKKRGFSSREIAEYFENNEPSFRQ